jgi:hypothetical protein
MQKEPISWIIIFSTFPYWSKALSLVGKKSTENEISIFRFDERATLDNSCSKLIMARRLFKEHNLNTALLREPGH